MGQPVSAASIPTEPLVVGGTRVVFEKHCEALTTPICPGIPDLSDRHFVDSCVAGGFEVCEPQLVHPAPAGQKWVEFRSTEPIADPPGDGVLRFSIVYTVPESELDELEGQPMACWFSDDRDDRYGSEIIDGVLWGSFGALPVD